MRPLDEKETTMVFEKLFRFTGPNLKHLLDRPAAEGPDPAPGRYCLRLHKNRVYYASESLVRRATAVARPRLAGLGTPSASSPTAAPSTSPSTPSTSSPRTPAAASGSSPTPSAPSSLATPSQSPPSPASPRTPRPGTASSSCPWPTCRSASASPPGPRRTAGRPTPTPSWCCTRQMPGSTSARRRSLCEVLSQN